MSLYTLNLLLLLCIHFISMNSISCCWLFLSFSFFFLITLAWYRSITSATIYERKMNFQYTQEIWLAVRTWNLLNTIVRWWHLVPNTTLHTTNTQSGISKCLYNCFQYKYIWIWWLRRISPTSKKKKKGKKTNRRKDFFSSQYIFFFLLSKWISFWMAYEPEQGSQWMEPNPVWFGSVRFDSFRFDSIRWDAWMKEQMKNENG